MRTADGKGTAHLHYIVPQHASEETKTGASAPVFPFSESGGQEMDNLEIGEQLLECIVLSA